MYPTWPTRRANNQDRKLKKALNTQPEMALMSSSTGESSVPPRDRYLGPVGYGPANPDAIVSGGSYAGRRQADQLSLGPYTRRYQPINPQPVSWMLPAALAQQGAILVLPHDVGQYTSVIDRWESITLNHMNTRIWDSNEEKVAYMENLLREHEKKMFISWRMQFPTEFEQLTESITNTQNFCSTIRRMIIGTDPYEGTTEEQNRAYNDLERLSCENMKDVLTYLYEYGRLAAISGRMWISEDLSNKFFSKLPSLIGKKIEEAFKRKQDRCHAAYSFYVPIPVRPMQGGDDTEKS